MQILVIFPDLPEEALATLRRVADVVGPIDAGDDWLTPLRTADAVIPVVQPQFTGAVLAQAPRLRVIGRPGIGVDNVDVAAATAAGICVINTPDAPTQPVVEKVIGWMLMLAHRLRAADDVARAPAWRGRSTLLGSELAGKTVGFVGLGRVGHRVARICTDGFGMRVLAFDPYVARDPARPAAVEFVATLAELLPQVDFLSINCPVTSETRGLIGAPQLRALKPTAYLINSARAPVIDEPALVQALTEHWFAGAALDVFAVEPPPPDHPLLRMENVLLGPHYSSFTREGMQRMAQQTVDQVLMVLRGERPPHLVNPAVWDQRRQ